eukprot:CAMPEP_0196719810 /NCGR_PEP_ID=MMETSP1091-20130531/2736_1 /TAXON_ID=302021 /ORGANISM="Rhodomonas sp., Strain CCMP768" /LENGTH=76 /DNA_ID=CAMNT_0042060873 /DNA_START=130 /DNA_END=357 /DNA_ORIENTATION=-
MSPPGAHEPRDMEGVNEDWGFLASQIRGDLLEQGSFPGHLEALIRCRQSTDSTRSADFSEKRSPKRWFWGGKNVCL